VATQKELGKQVSGLDAVDLAWQDLSGPWRATLQTHCQRLQQREGVEGGVTVTTIYGVKNCDTMKKARAWLEAHGVAYVFHDYKASGIDKATLEAWAKVVGWETLLNRAGTTFRKLPDADRADLTERKAIALMLAAPSMIKRPVLDKGGKLLVGFEPSLYAKAFVKR
jgi:arsenate reductase